MEQQLGHRDTRDRVTSFLHVLTLGKLFLFSFSAFVLSATAVSAVYRCLPAPVLSVQYVTCSCYLLAKKNYDNARHELNPYVKLHVNNSKTLCMHVGLLSFAFAGLSCGTIHMHNNSRSVTCSN